MKRIRISADCHRSTDNRWRGSTITFTNAKERKEVVLEIGDPWDLQHLREQLNKIAAHWKDAVKNL
jgi:hypothetical protein